MKLTLMHVQRKVLMSVRLILFIVWNSKRIIRSVRCMLHRKRLLVPRKGF